MNLVRASGSSLSLFATAAVVALALPLRGSPTPLPPAKRVDLRPEFERYGLVVRRQGARGSCSVFTVTAALELALARYLGRGEPLSVEFLNWSCCRLINDRRDRGQFFLDLQRAFETSGI